MIRMMHSNVSIILWDEVKEMLVQQKAIDTRQMKLSDSHCQVDFMFSKDRKLVDEYINFYGGLRS